MDEIEKPQERSKLNAGMVIVGINLAILAVYTLISKSTDGGIGLDAVLIVLHVITCTIMALAKKSWIWFLSGVLVLVIGFSTCVSLLPLNLH